MADASGDAGLLGRADGDERPFVVEHRRLPPKAKKPAKPAPSPKPKRATSPRRPLEGAPTLWRGRWADHHQRGDDEGEA